MNTVQSDKPVYAQGGGDATYLDVQAELGISKHMGGYKATDELHRRCFLAGAGEVLEVGCGIGSGPAYLATKFDGWIVAVDISEKMLAWAKLRARQARVADRITFRQADVRDLPFAADRFDAVIVESVLSFVDDKGAAIRELVRVTKPGGFLGLNETYWTEPVPANLLAGSAYEGLPIITRAEWQALWDSAPLEARTVEHRTIEPKQELRDRNRWIGGRWLLRVWGRAVKLMLTDHQAREALQAQRDVPQELGARMAYGLFVGRKPGT